MLEETTTDKCLSGMCMLKGSSGLLIHSINESGLMNLRYSQSQTERYRHHSAFLSPLHGRFRSKCVTEELGLNTNLYDLHSVFYFHQ